VPEGADIVEIHSIIDEIEQRIKNELGIDIVVHMDPVEEKKEDCCNDDK